MESINHKKYLRLAIPFTLCTVTQPLLGAVDTAVVGRLSSSSFIGGVVTGTVIFNTLYWLFGFLRVATSGFAAQTLAANHPSDLVHSWLRPLVIATSVGFLTIVLQKLILKGALLTYRANPDVEIHTITYFTILIWGAPLVLIGYANLGWLMGRGYVKEVVVLQIGTNSINIILDIIFVTCLHMSVAGVATATLISQATSFFLGIALIRKKLSLTMIMTNLNGLIKAEEIKKMLTVNTDLFIRTVFLLVMTNVFVARGSIMGTDILAANAILFQIQYLLAYLFDGLGNSASVFAGKFAGSLDRKNFDNARSIASINLAVLSIILAVSLFLFENHIINIFTDIAEVIECCHIHFFYLILYIPTMAIGLLYEGFYVGVTCSAPIRNSLLFALLVFLPAEYLLIPQFGNHGLWISFILFCAIRTSVLLLSWSRLQRETFNLHSTLAPS